MTDRLLTAAEGADRLALSTSTVLHWFEADRLPGFKLGRVVRFRESEVLAWLEAQRVGPLVALSIRIHADHGERIGAFGQPVCGLAAVPMDAGKTLLGSSSCA